MTVETTIMHPIQQAQAEGRAVFAVQGGELIPIRSYRENLARDWDAALNGYTIANHRLSEAYGISATANAAANYRADKTSTVPLKVIDKTETDVNENSPAQWFLANKTRLLWHIEMAMELWGVAYLLKHRGQGGYPFALEWIPTDWVTPERSLLTGHFETFYVRDVVGYTKDYKAQDIIRIDTFDPMMSDNGKSHFEIAMNRITTEKGLMRFAASFFLNSARPDGMLISKSRQTPDEMKKAEERWKMFKGAENAFNTFVSSGEWEWIPITPPPIDLEMGTLGDGVASDICRVFQVNPVLIGAGQAADPLSAQSTFRSIERAHVEGVTVPRLEYILGELNRQWLWVDFPQKQFYSLAVNKTAMRILSDINQEVTTAGQIGVVSGILDYDEAREHAGLQPREGYYLKRNPTDAVSVWNAGGIFMDELRAMVGLPPLPMNLGHVFLIGGQLIPADQLRVKAQQNVTPPAPAMPQLPQFTLADMERAMRAIMTEAQVRQSAERSAPVISGMEALVNEIRSLAQAMRDVVPITPQPAASVLVPVQVYAPLPHHAFVTYIQRQMAAALTDAGVLDVQYSDPDAWAISILNASVPADQAAQLLRKVDLAETFAFDVKTARLDWNREAHEDQPIIVSLVVEGRGLQQLYSSMHLMAQGANVLSQASYPCYLPLAMLPRATTDLQALEAALRVPPMAYAISVTKIAARAGDTPALVWDLDGLSPEQAAEFRVWRSKVEKKGTGVEFEFRALKDHRPSQWARLALRMGIDSKAVFDTAQKWARVAMPLDDKDADGIPDLYERYWHNFDALLEEMGEEWLDGYMGAAWETIQPRLSAKLSEGDIDDALRANHDTLATQWVGEDAEHPGALTKLILAGMAAGQMALIDNAPADYRAAFRAVDVTIDWNLMSGEAFRFAKKYGYDLIKGIDSTTRDKVSTAMQDWISNGGSLDDLTVSMEQIFHDKDRARLISNTESIRAYTSGSQERWRMADVTEAIWHTVRDRYVCRQCAPLHGTRANFDAGWTHPGGIMKDVDGNPVDTGALKGSIHKQPAHPGCRCFGRPVVSDAMAVLPPSQKPTAAPGAAPVKPTPAKPKPKVAKVEQPIVTDYADVTKMGREETREWGVKEYRAFRKFHDALSPEQKEAVRVYTTGEYRGINGRLRGVGWAKEEEGYDDTIKVIDTAFTRSRAPMNIITYRGIEGWQEEYDRYWNAVYNPGSEFQDKGYFSTSLAHEVSQSFGSGRYTVLFRCFIRKDVPSVYCGYRHRDGFEYAFPHECEVLLPRGQRWRITAIDKPTKYNEVIRVDILALFPTEHTRKAPFIMQTPNEPTRRDKKPDEEYQEFSKFWDTEPGDFDWIHIAPPDADPAQPEDTPDDTPEEPKDE